MDSCEFFSAEKLATCRLLTPFAGNLKRVTKIEAYSKDDHLVVALTTGAQLPVSRSGYARLRAFLDEKAPSRRA